MAWQVEYTDEFEAWWIGNPYAFDPRRSAILLIGGRKTGGRRWYERYVPWAEKIYEQHLTDLKKEQEGLP